MKLGWTKTPGLKVVYPAFPYDCDKRIIKYSRNDQIHLLFFGHKLLYRSVYQDVPKDYYTLPFGKASLIKGTDVTIISFGLEVHWALQNVSK